MTVDGGFGAWSGWSACSHNDGGSAGSCLCRTRACDSPVPQCGGQRCHGISVEVANCSRQVSFDALTAKMLIALAVLVRCGGNDAPNAFPLNVGLRCVNEDHKFNLCLEANYFVPFFPLSQLFENVAIEMERFWFPY